MDSKAKAKLLKDASSFSIGRYATPLNVDRQRGQWCGVREARPVFVPLGVSAKASKPVTWSGLDKLVRAVKAGEVERTNMRKGCVIVTR